MSNSSLNIDLEDYINSFSWDKRIVLFIAKDINFINETDDFFKTNSCENEEDGDPFEHYIGCEKGANLRFVVIIRECLVELARL